MEKRIKEIIFFLSVSLMVCLNLNAQDSVEEQSLSKIIIKLQRQYNIQFNYAEDNIKDISLKSPSKDISLTEALKYLETITGVTWSRSKEKVGLVKPKGGLGVCG